MIGAARILAVAAALGCTPVPAARAVELPLWEAGAGATVLDFPDYRGSDERHTLVLPFPYLVYHGDFFKADEDSIRGQFYRDERVELQLSLNGSIPVDSSDNAARRGMPNLDPTLEIGPNLILNLYRSPTMHLNLRLPLRAVIASDFSHVHDEGWVFEPQLNVDFYDHYPAPGWNLGFAAGPLYGNSRYHGYFYDVPSHFATPARPAYDAPGGYGGVQAIASLTRRFGQWWVGGFVRADTLAGAVFEDSPLVRQKDAFFAGVAFAWVFSRSSKTVQVDDE